MAMSNYNEQLGEQFQEEFTDLNGEVEEVKPPFEVEELADGKLKYTNNHSKIITARMNDHKCDVKFKVDGQNFKGHKNILKEASDYFNAMFSHQMKERDEKEIELREVSAAGFCAMMDSFYTGTITMDPKNIADVLKAARFFHVDWVLDICSDYLSRHLYLIDYALTMQLAEVHSLGDLRWDIFRNLGSGLPMLMEKETFLKDLSPDLLMQFLMESTMFVELSEFNLLQLIINWVHCDEARRKEHFLPLLRQLRFPTMELEELEAIPREVMEFQEIREEVEEAKSNCFDVACQCLKTKDKFLPRGARPTIIVTAFNDETQQNVVVYKDPENPESNLFIENLGESGLATDYSTANQARIGNFLFSIGGYEYGSCASSSRMFRYDPKLREWEEVASLNQPRVSFASCNSDKRMFVCGGVFHTVGDLGESEKILSSVEMYNPEENSWKALASLPQGCFDLAAEYDNNVIYVSGGISDIDTKPIPIAEAYSLTVGNDQWSPLTPMLTPRQGHSMTAHCGKLLVLGGYTGSGTGTGFRDCFDNEMFDIETRQWTALTSTPENFGHLFRHVGCYGNKIYFLCNQDAEAFLCTYDIEADTFGEGVFIGSGFHKVAYLQVPYPQV